MSTQENIQLDNLPKQLSFIGRFLTLWIFMTMAGKVALGYFISSFTQWLTYFQVGLLAFPLALSW